MRAIRRWAILLLAGSALLSSPLLAGVGVAGHKCGCRQCSEETCRESCWDRWCKPAPRAELAFAIPGVLREGQAIPVPAAVVERAVRESAARDLVGPEAEKIQKACDERIQTLQKEVEQLKLLMDRLSIAVATLAEVEARKESQSVAPAQQPAQAPAATPAQPKPQPGAPAQLEPQKSSPGQPAKP